MSADKFTSPPVFPPSTPRLHAMEAVRDYLLQLRGTVSIDDRRSHAILRKGIEHLERDICEEAFSDDANSELRTALRMSTAVEAINARLRLVEAQLDGQYVGPHLVKATRGMPS